MIRQERAVQKINVATATTTRHETLRQNISKEASDVVGPDRGMLST